MARSGAVSAVLILLTVMAAAPAEARQRGGVVDVIPPDEVERIFQQGDCGHAHATDEDVRFFLMVTALRGRRPCPTASWSSGGVR